jgi:hypothetical protein
VRPGRRARRCVRCLRAGERVPDESLGLAGRHLRVVPLGQDRPRIMRGEGAGQHRGWPGFAERGQHPRGDTKRLPEEQPGAAGVALQRRSEPVTARSARTAPEVVPAERTRGPSQKPLIWASRSRRMSLRKRQASGAAMLLSM